MEIVNRNKVKPFITKDTSEIREILAPRNSSIKKQSLAEAKLGAGKITEEHYHIKVEEIYYILRGSGKMWLDGESREVTAGDGIAILPGKKHRIENTGSGDLVFLCCCAPAYTHEDTVLVS
ncbi:MAG: cupin domain-containing protein [Dehalococcoidales bacterium]|nr:cupin domain-containing protein [Dehalococcoidales bacterium]